MNVAFAAGGTGGHINPALAIADKLKEVFPDTNILFIGSPDGLEAKLVKKAGYDFASVKMAGIQRKLTPHNIKLNVQAVHYYLSAGKRIKKIFDDFSPDLVIGTGGYVTGTVLKTAIKCGIKTARKWNSFHLTGEQTVNFSDLLFTSHFFVLYCKMRYHVKRDSGACVKVRAREGQNALRTRRGRELRAQTRGRKERKPDEQQPSTL